jgi:hypothetical protein
MATQGALSLKKSGAIVSVGEHYARLQRRGKPVALFNIGIGFAGIELYAAATGKAAQFEIDTAPPQTPLGGVYVVIVKINELAEHRNV